MKAKIQQLLILLVTVFGTISCNKDNDDNLPGNGTTPTPSFEAKVSFATSYTGTDYNPINLALTESISQITYWIYDESTGMLVEKIVQNASDFNEQTFGKIERVLPMGNYQIRTYGTVNSDVFNPCDDDGFDEEFLNKTALVFSQYSDTSPNGDIMSLSRRIILEGDQAVDMNLSRQNTQIKLVLLDPLSPKVKNIKVEVLDHSTLVDISTSKIIRSVQPYLYHTEHIFTPTAEDVGKEGVSSIFTLLSNSLHDIRLSVYGSNNLLLKTVEVVGIPLSANTKVTLSCTLGIEDTNNPSIGVGTEIDTDWELTEPEYPLEPDPNPEFIKN